MGASSSEEIESDGSEEKLMAAEEAKKKRKRGPEQVDDPKNKLRLDKFHRPIKKTFAPTGEAKSSTTNKPIKR